MNDDSTILISGESIKDDIRMSSTNLASNIISSTINNNLEKLGEHIDYLHTKISDMEDRLVMLESIVLKKN